jgi:hypothetical protein
MSCAHIWTPYHAEGLTFNARCDTCGELALHTVVVAPEEAEDNNSPPFKEVLEEGGAVNRLLCQLRDAGYDIGLRGENIVLKYVGEGQPDAAIAEPLFEKAKACKAEIIRCLTEAADASADGRSACSSSPISTSWDPVLNFEDGIADDTQAERYLEWLRYRNSKIDEISQRMDAEIKRLEDRKGQLLSGHRQRADYLEASLKKYLWESGQKRIDYAYGTLSRRRGRERVEVEDETAFCFKYGDNADLVATTRRPDKVGIKAHIKSTGDIPDGADLVRGDDTCTITLTTGAAP